MQIYPFSDFEKHDYYCSTAYAHVKVFFCDCTQASSTSLDGPNDPEGERGLVEILVGCSSSFCFSGVCLVPQSLNIGYVYKVVFSGTK